VALARYCAREGAQFLTFSSDLVFDGAKGSPYVESDTVNPLNVYGRSKAEAEAGVLAALPEALIARTSAFFGPWDDYNFVTVALRVLAAGERFSAADDTIISPTYVLELVRHSLDLLIDGESGIWHFANQGGITWADLARRVATRAGFDVDLVEGRPMRDFRLAAARPLYSVMSSERGLLLNTIDVDLDHYFAYTGEAQRGLPLWETLAAQMRFSVGRKDLLVEVAR
jgi:dTDP-4-dehydrorhamnose reductase